MENTTMQPPIPLIVGAGPTGMMLSLWLQKFLVPHRIVDAASRTGMSSRAMILHARNLELYRQLGLDEELIALGTKMEEFAVHYNGMLRCQIHMGRSGQGLSKYPFMLSITQDEHEALLERTIIKRGGKVDRGTQVVSVQEDKDTSFVEVMLNAGDKTEKFLASYVIGCDGAHSSVRSALHIEMQGGTYDKLCFVADVLASGYPTVPGQLNMCLSSEDFLMVIPLPHIQGRARLIGFVPIPVEDAKLDKFSFEDVKSTVYRNAKDLVVEKVNWFSHYRVHYKTAARFQQNRVFLCGDAAHIHSPVGGQGMNTGLGDVSNLAWKLAAVHNRAPTSILDTYALERTPFARKLVATTDLMFTKMIGSDWISRSVRNIIWPYIMPLVLRYVNVGPTIFQKTSQLELEYLGGPLSLNIGSGPGDRTAARAGNRLPWIEDADDNGDDNHSRLATVEWQAHVYGETEVWVEEFLRSKNVSFHQFDWTQGMTKVGLREKVTYLVRPDGYIGVTIGAGADQAKTETQLGEYCEKWVVSLIQQE